VLTTLLLALAVVVLGLLVVAARQPAEFRITRTATIAGPPPGVFAQVNDFHNWEAWSPWARIGGQFERGLAQMKALVEAAPKA
jgi:hypothetical protein